MPKITKAKFEENLQSYYENKTEKKWIFWPIIAIFLLTAPFTISDIINSLFVSVIFSIFVFLAGKFADANIFEKRAALPIYWLFFAIASYACVKTFVERWLNSTKLLELLKQYEITPDVFLWCIGIILGLHAFIEMNIIHICIHSFLKNYEYRKIPTFLCATAIFSIIQCFQLNFSAVTDSIFLFPSFFPSLCIQFLLLICLNGILIPLFRNTFKAFTVSALISTTFSIINYYVTVFHGKPFYISELSNAATAFNVLSGYSLSFTFELGLIILFGATLLFFLFSYKSIFNITISVRKSVLTLMLSISGICAIGIVLIQTTIIDTVRWSWSVDIQKNGYLVCTVKSLNDILHPFRQFTDYDVETISLSNLTMPDTNETSNVDFILILNESFCNLEEFSELNPDINVLETFYNIPGAVYGYSYSSDIGGGTNNSEFELLTSHSMYLLNNDAPFNYINFNLNAQEHVVSYLKQFDYLCTAMHCGEKSNYSRNTAYFQIGFDNIYLGSDQFTNGNYENRQALDSVNYQDLICHYQNNYGKNQFLYLLTYQNHGGYTQNESTLDTVHIKKNYGSLSSEINEYLTSVKMSADAFRELTSYFTTVDRPVVICMVGDHAPHLIEQLTEKNTLTEQELQISKRKVPFVLWSNHEDITLPEHVENASMVDLVPLMLESAGLPLSTYYTHILSLNEEIPIRLRNGIYQDKYGIVGEYGSGTEHDDLLAQYYGMEYNSLNHNENYRRELFYVK